MNYYQSNYFYKNIFTLLNALTINNIFLYIYIVRDLIKRCKKRVQKNNELHISHSKIIQNPSICIYLLLMKNNLNAYNIKMKTKFKLYFYHNFR